MLGYGVMEKDQVTDKCTEFKRAYIEWFSMVWADLWSRRQRPENFINIRLLPCGTLVDPDSDHRLMTFLPHPD